jgi:hypothetical protein
MQNGIRDFIYFLAVFIILISSRQCSVYAAEIQEEPANQTNHGDLTQESSQTLASLASITIRDLFIASFWDRPGSANIVEFRSLLPFKVWNQKNLMRISVPFRTHSEIGTGLNFVRIFDLVLLGHPKTLWGIGPVVNFGTGQRPGADTFQAGPAVGAVISSIKNLSFGILNQNLLSGQVALSTLQPILVYKLSESWTIGLGELPLVYNWKKGEFSIFALGFQIGFVTKPGGQSIRVFLNPQYNTTSNTELYRWTIASGLTFILSPQSQQGLN